MIHWLMALFILLSALWWGYIYAFCQLRVRAKPWPVWRLFSWSMGIIFILVALYPPVMLAAHTYFIAHMWVHLLLGMLAPLCLVMAAPLTLLIQIVKPRISRYIYLFLNWPVIRFLSHPVNGMMLNVGGMYLLYLTPLYALSTQTSWVSALVHWHFFIAGCIFMWAIAGPDRAPRRPSYRLRLLILFLSIGAHATLSKIIYAYGLPYDNQHALADVQAGAQAMYYGGGLAELLLIIAFFSLWFNHPQSQQH